LLYNSFAIVYVNAFVISVIGVGIFNFLLTV
jgi:hypothetical protein